MRMWGAAALAVLLAGCSNTIVPRGMETAPAPARSSATRPPSTALPVRQPVAATPMAPAAVAPVAGAVTAAASGVLAGPASLPITAESAERALAAFRISCPSLVRRTDASGLTQPGDWVAACNAAATVPAGGAMQFFATQFEPAQVGEGRAFATGYFEPEIAGSRRRERGYDVPVYAKPSDLVEVDLGLFSDAYKGKRIRGRVEGSSFVPYYDRTQIEKGALEGRGLEIGWAADPIEFFFLQVQGSGRLRLPDGSVMRIGYAGQNGRDYTGIGKLMKDRGLLGPGQSSMQGIVAWLRAHPAEGRAIMRENKSFVFFRELTGAGPLGALGVPVTGQASVAADPKFVPLGAPVFLSMDRTDATGLWVAQDTGGAIKGANRFDTFWGAGDEARAIAGGMSARGTAFVLLPRGAVARLNAGRGGRPTP
nr:murein transglycosylase A [uncultured Sphingomonas sp.]